MKKRNVKRRFGDTEDSAEDKKVLPGLPRPPADLKGDERERLEREQKRQTTRICSGVLQGTKVTLPPGKTKAQIKNWCVTNMQGVPSRVGLSEKVAPVCKGLSTKACVQAMRRAAEPDAAGLKVPLTKVVSKGPAFVTKTVKGASLVPATDNPVPCKPSASGKIRDCHYELRFFSPEAAQKKNLPGPGPYIRMCGSANEPGTLFKVESPEEAKALLDKHCACRRGGKDMKECDAVGPKPAGFGRNPFGLHGYGLGRRK